MMRAVKRSTFFSLALAACHCGEPLPDDIEGYRARCLPVNCEPIPVKEDDPHEGVKNVYACGISQQELGDVLSGEPYPVGTIMVKESTRPDSDYPWLVATARKKSDGWHWNEYSRNFEDEEYLGILASEQVCIDCHRKARAADWIYTRYPSPDGCGN